MADDAQTVRKGSQIWIDGVMIAECPNESIAAIIQLALIRAKVSVLEYAVLVDALR